MSERFARAVDLIQAGGLVPLGAGSHPPTALPTDPPADPSPDPSADLPADLPVDRVAARTYSHPALGDRVVVRLEADAIAAGVDVEMSLLGFAAPFVTGDLALRRRRAPGFPGWALVNDPARARYALELMKDFRQAARLAISKPGHARDGFVAIAERLGRSVPHFLPSFWEEAGRMFLEAGSRSFAAIAFEKARLAEKEYGLPVDEAVRAETFLEFALAGALAIKSLTAWAKDLEKSRGAEIAFEHFFNLCVKRTLGGLPPWTGMATDLRRLAKAARRDVAAEDERLIGAILDAPGIGRAPVEFWKQYRPSLIRAANASPRVRGRLLNLFPRPPSGRDDFPVAWLELLDELEALEAVTAPAGQVPREAEATGSPAAWFGRLLEFLDDNRPVALYKLLRRMAARLIDDDIPLPFEDPEDWRHQIDVDLLDLALELRVPVPAPSDEARFDLEDWAKGKGDESEALPRNPTYVQADERFRELLESAVDGAAGEEEFEAVAAGRSALILARRGWLMKVVGQLEPGGLPGLSAAIGTLEQRTAAPIFREFPEAWERLLAADPHPALQRTLNAGLLDELGWPLFEAAWKELRAGGRPPVEVTGEFPYLILHTQSRAVVLGPGGRVLEHDLQLPSSRPPVKLIYADGQLLVICYNADYDLEAWWSGNPTAVFPYTSDRYSSASLALDLPGGGTVRGERALHAGDTQLAKPVQIFSDGSTFWIEAAESEEESSGTGQRDAGSDPEDAHRVQLVEIDVRTGKRGAISMPLFFSRPFSENLRLDLEDSALYPLPAQLEQSPLGSRDGLWGRRVLRPRKEEGSREVEWLDGRRFVGELGEEDETPQGLISLPGGDVPRPVYQATHYWGGKADGFQLWEPGGAWLSQSMGSDDDDDDDDDDDEARTPRLTPAARVGFPFWHYLTPRDLPGSHALRIVGLETVTALIRQARAELSPAPGQEAGQPVDPGLSATRALLARELPLSDTNLIEAVIDAIRQGARLAERLERLKLERDPAGRGAQEIAVRAGADDLSDDDAKSALGSLSGARYVNGELTHTLRLASNFFAGSLETPTGPFRRKLPGTDLQWWHWLGRSRALAFQVVTPGLKPAEREIGLRLLEHWSRTVFAGDLPHLRVVTITLEDASSPFLFRSADDEDDIEECWMARTGAGNLYYVHAEGYGEGPFELTLLELAPEGRFALPPGAVLNSERRPELTDQRDWLAKFVAEARARGDIPWTPAIGEALAERTGLTRAEATLLWSGLPGFSRWQSDFLGKELRERLGLKTTEAKTARESLEALTAEHLAILFDTAAPDDPAQLWHPLGEAPESPEAAGSSPLPAGDSPVDRLAGKWLELFGRREALPQELLTALDKELELAMSTSQLLQAIMAPDRADCLNRDADWHLDSAGDVERNPASPEGFDLETLTSFAVLLPWLYAALPVGEAVRNRLPDVYARLRARLAHPGLLLPLSNWWYDKQKKKARGLLEGLGGVSWLPSDPDPDQKLEGRDNGLLVGLMDEDSLALAFRPSRVSSYADDQTLRRLTGLAGDDATAEYYQAAAVLASPGLEAMMARIGDTPLAAGAWELDPSHSAGPVVREVKQALEVSDDAAALYLQLLALAEPTAKHVQKWNGWKAARYQKAAGELVAKGRVIEAKRARAGRDHFLPGGWTVMKGKGNLPLETWKLELYGIVRPKDGGPRAPLERIVMLEPAHALFERAWARVKAGDGPKFDERG